MIAAPKRCLPAFVCVLVLDRRTKRDGKQKGELNKNCVCVSVCVCD